MKDKISAEVFGKGWKFTEEEFDFVKQLLGEPIPFSVCCGEQIDDNIDQYHTARCSECGEGTGVVYVWSK